MSNARIQRSTSWKWLKPRLNALGFEGAMDDTLRRERGGFVDRFAWEVVGGKSGSFPKLEVSVGVDSIAVAEALAATEPRSGLPEVVGARRPMQCSIPLLRFEEESVLPLGMMNDDAWPLVKGADPTSVLEEAWQLLLDRALPSMEAVRDVEGYAALVRRYARRVSDWLEVAISLALGQRDEAAVVLNEMLNDPERLAQRGKYAIQHEESRAPLRSLLRELRPHPDPEPVDRPKLQAWLVGELGPRLAGLGYDIAHDDAYDLLAVRKSTGTQRHLFGLRYVQGEAGLARLACTVGIDDTGIDPLLQLGPTDPRPWRWYDLQAFVGDQAAGREPGRWPPRWTLRTPSALQPALDDIWRIFETQADPSMRAVDDPASHARWLLSRAADGSRPAPVIAALLLLSYRTTAAAQVLWLGRSVPLRAREIGIAPIQGYGPPVPGPLLDAVQGARHRGLLTAMFPSRWKLWEARRPTRPFPASARVLLQVAEQWSRFDPKLPDDAHLITADGGSALQYLGGDIARTLMATTIGYPPFGAPQSEVPLRIDELDVLSGSRYVIHLEKVHLLDLEDEAEAKALRACILETTQYWHDPKSDAPWRLQWLLTCRPAQEERVRGHLVQLGIPCERWPGHP